MLASIKICDGITSSCFNADSIFLYSRLVAYTTKELLTLSATTFAESPKVKLEDEPPEFFFLFDFFCEPDDKFDGVKPGATSWLVWRESPPPTEPPPKMLLSNSAKYSAVPFCTL